VVEFTLWGLAPPPSHTLFAPMRFMRVYKKAHLRRSYSTGMEIAKRWPSPRRIL